MSGSEWLQLLVAGLSVIALRGSLWIFPMATLRRWAAGAPRRRRAAAMSRAEAEGVCRAVMTVARFVPAATCLTQALAAETLLSRAGFSTSFCFGVGKTEGRLRAHAWLEDDQGGVLIGHADMAGLSRLNALVDSP
ncbi:MAG: lasso peptide biosynthesis B2 protein [Tepidisphaeraceae bacterium]|jgi:hypothetical protein